MHRRRLALGAAPLVLILGVAACQPVDGGAGGSSSPEASAAESAATSNGAPADPTDAPGETPIATMGGDYNY